jgi:hypothetical protein
LGAQSVVTSRRHQVDGATGGIHPAELKVDSFKFAINELSCPSIAIGSAPMYNSGKLENLKQ